LGIAIIYFRSFLCRFLAVLTVAPVVYTALAINDKKKIRRNLYRLLKQSLGMLAFYLRVGKSLPEATTLVADELRRLNPVEKDFVAAWQEGKQQISLNQPVGKVYQNLAAKLAIKPAYVLAGVLTAGLKTGANLVKIAEDAGQRLQEQLDYEETIAASLAGRRLEGYILLSAPSVLIFLLSGTLNDYMNPLFQGKGSLIMWLILTMQLGGSLWFFLMLNKAEKLHQDLAAAYFMDILALFLQAGLALPAAWQRAAELVEDFNQEEESSFWLIVQKVNKALSLNGSLTAALNIMEKDGEERAVKLALLLQQNMRKGGGRLAYTLVNEAKQIRVEQARRLEVNKGRQEIYLLFPLILLLLSSMLLTVAPALMSMKV